MYNFFFEMPLDPILAESQLATYQRNTIKSILSGSGYRWITPDSLKDYETEDGIHLLEKSVFKYFKYLDSKSNNILSME